MHQGLIHIAIYGSASTPRITQEKHASAFFKYFHEVGGNKGGDRYSTYYDIEFHYHSDLFLEDVIRLGQNNAFDMLLILDDQVDGRVLKKLHSTLHVPIVMLLHHQGVGQAISTHVKESHIHPVILSHHKKLPSLIEQLFRIALYEAILSCDQKYVMHLVEQLAHATYWLEGDLQCIHYQKQTLAKLNVGQDMVRQYIMPDLKHPLSQKQEAFLCLHLAARLGLSKATDFLMNKQAVSPSVFPHIRGHNPLHAAVLSQNLGVIKVLMAHQSWFSVWAREHNDYGLDPLELASLVWPKEEAFDQVLFAMIALMDDQHNPWDIMIQRSLESMRDIVLSRFLLAPYSRSWFKAFSKDKTCQHKKQFQDQHLFDHLRTQIRLSDSHAA